MGFSVIGRVGIHDDGNHFKGGQKAGDLAYSGTKLRYTRNLQV